MLTRRRNQLALLIVLPIAAIVFIAALFLSNQGIKTGQTVSKTGNQIAFLHFPPQKFGNIYILDTTTNTMTQLTRREVVWRGTWSPDGERIAFLQIDKSQAHIYVLDVSSGDLVNLTPEDGRPSVPKWSPDGEQLLFADNGIFIINSDGSGRKKVLEGQSPDWSPDGTQIVYVSGEDDDDKDIYIADVDGTNSRPLVIDDMSISSPQWSPSGTHILYLEDVFNERGNIEQQVVSVVAIDGGQPTQIGELFLETLPQWSPDGTQIAYNTNLGVPRVQVCIVDISDYSQECEGRGEEPMWHPDGERFIHLYGRDGDICIAPSECFDTPLRGKFSLIGWRP